MMKAEKTAKSGDLAFCTYDLELRFCWKLFSGLPCLMEEGNNMVIINTPLTSTWCYLKRKKAISQREANKLKAPVLLCSRINVTRHKRLRH